MPGKSRLPPQWSKWRCVLTTTATTHELIRERVRVPLLAVVFDRRRRVDHPRVDEDEPVGMLDRVGEARQAVTLEDHFARQVPTDVVMAEHGIDSFPGGRSGRHALLNLGVGPLGDP
jgi:hypothetical protein